MIPDTYAAPVQPVSRPRVRIVARLEPDSPAAMLAIAPALYLAAVMVGAEIARAILAR
jgi:hypothetical protein